MEVNMADNSNINEKKKKMKMKMKMKNKKKMKMKNKKKKDKTEKSMNRTMNPKITKGSHSVRKREQFMKLKTPIEKANLLARVHKRMERINILRQVSDRLSVLAKWMEPTVALLEVATDPMLMSTTMQRLEIQFPRVEMEAERVEDEFLYALRQHEGGLCGCSMIQQQVAAGDHCPHDVSVGLGLEAAGHADVASSSMTIENDDEVELSRRLADSRLEG